MRLAVNTRIVLIALSAIALVGGALLWQTGALSDRDCTFTLPVVTIHSIDCDALHTLHLRRASVRLSDGRTVVPVPPASIDVGTTETYGAELPDELLDRPISIVRIEPRCVANTEGAAEIWVGANDGTQRLVASLGQYCASFRTYPVPSGIYARVEPGEYIFLTQPRGSVNSVLVTIYAPPTPIVP